MGFSCGTGDACRGQLRRSGRAPRAIRHQVSGGRLCDNHAMPVLSSESSESSESSDIDEVRARIDDVDRQIVTLLARREVLVRRAGRLKTDVSQVPAPRRAALVVDSAAALAATLGADPGVVRATYTAMVSAFIALESSTIVGQSPLLVTTD